ncbi:MAG: T9SS type A sorting domain-containing protein [Bacteroidia bacterium]|nr:T9SS type A sorting domain-containing protein [Bacteroidia bacterium]
MMIQRFTKLGKTLGLVGLLSLSGLIEAQNFNWAPAGPIYSAGRSRNMVIDKSDVSGKTLFVGSTTSGVFRSIDGGANWAAMDDQGTVRNISYMAQASDNIIYVGTGEGFLRPGQKAKAQAGTGLYKLNGNTLVPVAGSAITGTVINRIACHPTNSNIIALATNLGVLISTDGGTSFNAASVPNTTVNVTVGIDVKFNSAGILFFSIGNSEGTSSLATVATKVYKSTDNTLSSFTNITPVSAVLSDSNYGRIELAVSPSSPNVIYASCAKKYTNNSSASLQGLFVSDDAGANWGLIVQGSSQIDPLSNGGTIATGDYSQVILVNPTNPGQLFIGGYYFFVWTKTSASYVNNPIGLWAQAGSPFASGSPFYLHENIHDIKIAGSGSTAKFYFITDAGIYRSSDIVSVNQNFPPSFQPFYKGLVTGQFNSVSIESFPLGANTGSNAVPGSAVVPYSGFIGGTGANGLTYYSGTADNVSSEISYLSGEVYNAEYSKILSDAALTTVGTGGLYRTTNAKNANPALVNVNYYSGALSKVAPTAADFVNTGYATSGTPFKLWENHGQVSPTPDNAVFYNDSSRFQASMIGLATLTTQTSFSFQAARPNKFALIDSIVIRTATVTVPGAPVLNVPFSGSDRKDLMITLNPSYSVGSTTTVPSFTVVNVTPGTTSESPYGLNPSSNALHGVTLNAQSLSDNISITFTAPPFANKTQTFANVPDPASYYRVFATVFYKYKAGDTIQVVDNNISTKTTSYTAVLTNSLSWRYGPAPAYTLVANTATPVLNPTFVVTPGNATSNSATITVNNWLAMPYTITTTGDYTLSVPPVEHTITATSTLVSPTSYTLFPGAITQTNAVFVVTPTATTIYTITANNGTATADTYSTIGASTFVLDPGNVNQASNIFTVNLTASAVFTLQGLSSNTLTGLNTSATTTLNPIRTFSTVGGTGYPPFPSNNPTVKIPMVRSARLALALNYQQITGGANAIVVSKAPLNLNDPLNFVRVSQSGCLTDDANGAPTNSTISIPGKPTLIEWSKKGTELYYATDDNKLYRVSHITDIMDLSPSSYSGKFFTDVFAYNGGSPSTPNAATINPVSPYRTTLIGSFTKPITSINITNDDAFMALTFNDPAPTGTAGIVMYNTNSIKTSNSTNIGWSKRDGTGLSNVVTYCALLEANDNKKMFVGTDNGIYYTPDVTSASPAWVKANNGILPNVQIFDIEQQTLNNSSCYNSGQIYVATNGRGIWTNNAYLNSYYVSVEEFDDKVTENNITMYPNPTSGAVTIEFETENNEEATIQVFDLNGRMVKSLPAQKAGTGMMKQTLETGDLNAGIYIISVSGDSNVKRAAKLIVTK